MWHKNSSKVYEHPEFVSSQLAAVQELGVIEEYQQSDLHCILALDLLPKPDGDKHLILNGHPLKQYKFPPPFKMDHLWKEGRYLFAGCTHGSIIDISNAFYHIDLAAQNIWDMNGLETSTDTAPFPWASHLPQLSLLRSPFPWSVPGVLRVYMLSDTWTIFLVLLSLP